MHQTLRRARPLIMACLALLTAAIGGLALPTAAQASDEPAYYQIVNRYSDECLDVWGASTQHAANVGVWRCVGADNQLWYKESAGRFDNKDYFYIKARHTGMCLNVAYYGQANGSDVVQATCSNGTNEQWELVQVDDTSYYRLAARHSGKCLDKTASGDVVQWKCWGRYEEWQHWRFAYIGGTV
ncbi:hypothetical protein Vau01_099360 [Virgisporangium aurantiacum]|uniref:Ricin B lectin domain-containing protein n=2 Tax=Virgisporangium aurantiacum TaxID=175570 RepID=A0A8J3ZJ13_9ACTN|nr:hypothetical protein Vau01_099360 [Virgisporangium aurantiacum]